MRVSRRSQSWSPRRRGGSCRSRVEHGGLAHGAVKAELSAIVRQDRAQVVYAGLSQSLDRLEDLNRPGCARKPCPAPDVGEVELE